MQGRPVSQALDTRPGWGRDGGRWFRVRAPHPNTFRAALPVSSPGPLSHANPDLRSPSWVPRAASLAAWPRPQTGQALPGSLPGPLPSSLPGRPLRRKQRAGPSSSGKGSHCWAFPRTGPLLGGLLPVLDPPQILLSGGRLCCQHRGAGHPLSVEPPRAPDLSLPGVIHVAQLQTSATGHPTSRSQSPQLSPHPPTGCALEPSLGVAGAVTPRWVRRTWLLRTGRGSEDPPLRRLLITVRRPDRGTRFRHFPGRARALSPPQAPSRAPGGRGRQEAERQLHSRL